MAPRLCLVVAVARNGVIGRDNDLPWHLPADLRHFRAVTMGKPVIMGRRTWESIGRPLPGRYCIVVTSAAAPLPAGVVPACSLEHALHIAAAEVARTGAEEIMVIGGARLYAAALPLAERIYLTEVDAHPEGDTRFPALDAGDWFEAGREHRPADDDNASACDFVVLERARRD